MKKRFFSILLSLCMVLMLCPVTALAEGDDTSELQNLLNNNTLVTLERDYTITSTLNVTKDVTLDLNGHVIKMTGDGRVITVNMSKSLTLQDSNPTATHDGANASLPAGGVITGGRATSHDYNGMGVCVETGASFTMNGGTITDCSTDNLGGGVYNAGSFTMSGGSITGCSASSNGGGVFNKGSFTMNGGSITGCSAPSAGGVILSNGGGVFNKGSFTMNDGSITGCSADLGVDVYNESSNSIVFYANGGEIRELYNSAPQLTIRKDNDTDGTIFSGDVTNYLSTIGAGIYRGAVTNAKKISHNFGGTISGGTFEGQ